MNKDELINILQNQCPPFYEDWGFWTSLVISLILGAISIVYSLKSFNEAKAAKEEAKKAGQTVKRQSIIIDIMEISRLCKISQDFDYSKVSSNYNDANEKISYILGLYRTDLISDNKELIDKINENLSSIRSALMTVNPVSNTELSTVPSYVYYTLEPHFAELMSNLGELKGILDNKNINV